MQWRTQDVRGAGVKIYKKGTSCMWWGTSEQKAFWVLVHRLATYGQKYEMVLPLPQYKI